MDPGTTHVLASDALSGISVGLACGDAEPDDPDDDRADAGAEPGCRPDAVGAIPEPDVGGAVAALS